MKVVLALDGSQGATVARDLVAGLPWPSGTVVHLVAAYLVPVYWTAADPAGTLPMLDDAETSMRDELDALLDAMAEPLATAGLEVARHVVRGRPATAICETATSLEADLIVTGSHGRGAIASMLLGSVAAEVATTAPCPVLVARGATIRRLLVATDGSSSSDRIPARLEAWGLFRGTPADVVAVSIPDSPTFEFLVGLYTLGDPRLAEKRRELRDQYRVDAQAMSERLTAAGIPATPHLRAGNPSEQILALRDETEADLVVTGTHGRDAVERLLLGSVARNVLVHARCSVLVIRPGPTPEADRAEPPGRTGP